MKKIISLLSLSALLLVSCSKSSSPTSTNNNNNGNTAAPNQVVATVNGTAITFKTLAHTGGTYTQVAGYSSLSFAIAGTDSATGSTFTIGGGGFVGTGTYDIGLEHGHGTASDEAFAVDYTKKGSGSSTEFRSDQNNATKVGTITITSVSATGAQGTFTATNLPQTNPSGTNNTVNITNGAFNVTF